MSRRAFFILVIDLQDQSSAANVLARLEFNSATVNRGLVVHGQPDDNTSGLTLTMSDHTKLANT